MFLAQTFHFDIFIGVTLALMLCITAITAGFVNAMLERSTFPTQPPPTTKKRLVIATLVTLIQILIGAFTLFLIGGFAWPQSFNAWAFGAILSALLIIPAGAFLYCKLLPHAFSTSLGISITAYITLLVATPSAIMCGAFAAVLLKQ